MKKIVSVIVFGVLLVWTWNVINSSSANGFETHSSIQEKFSELIINSIQSKLPTASEIKIRRMWTENLSDKKIKVIFIYQYSEPANEASKEATQREVRGEAVLGKEASDDPTVDHWKLESNSVVQDQIQYKDGSTVTPNNADQDEKSNESP